MKATIETKSHFNNELISCMSQEKREQVKPIIDLILQNYLIRSIT